MNPQTAAPVRRTLGLGFCAAPALMNAIINPAVASVQTRGVESLPLWGDAAAIAPDTLGTGFFLPAMTCVIVTPLVRRSVRRGTIPALPSDRVPGRLWVRALAFGLGGLGVFGGGSLMAFSLSEVDPMPRESFLVWKALSTAVLGAIVTPWIAWRALGDRGDAKGACPPPGHGAC